MYNLFLKDLRLQKFMILFYIGIICLYQINLTNLLFTVSVIGCMYMFNAHFNDEKDNNHKFINSLPYSRKTIILSKYAGTLIFTFFATVFTLVFQISIDALIPHFGIKIGTLKEIGASFAIIMVLTSFYLPFFYRFTNKYLLAGFSIVFLVFLFTWKKIINFMDLNKYLLNINTQFSTTELSVFTFIITLVLFIGSYFLTVRIYERTDF